MNASATPIPLACNPHALSATEWAAHQATSARLFTEFRKSGEALSDGDAFHVPAGAFALVAAFVETVRRCCPFLTFHIDVLPGAARHHPAYHGKPASTRHHCSRIAAIIARRIRRADTGNGVLMELFRSLAFFLAAGLCEIGGGYLVWIWLRDGRSPWYAVLGAVLLVLYGIIPTFQPAHFSRVYTAYGGVFVLLSILWGWRVDGIAPDRFDLIGATLVLLGVAVMMYWPRAV